ncbi:MAG TPA: lysyl oxidase family protein [Actinomycetota bacterium]|nr:lysyl oxidase family protein [Actinomycetota bacterium]
MPRTPRSTRRVALLLTVIASLILSLVQPATAADPPTVRLFAASTHVTAERGRNDVIFVDPGIWVASEGGAFELRASRPDYDTPPSLVQTDASTGSVLRTLPSEMLDGWGGLRDFVHLRVRDPDGTVVLSDDLPFCPNTYYRARLSDEGPLNSIYPYICGGSPFTRGTVWGIDAQWAVSAFSDFGIEFRAPRRHYRMRVHIDPAWTAALGIAPENARADVQITVVPRGSLRSSPTRPATTSAQPGPRVPTVTTPDPQSLPDLMALPAWSISISSRRGRDILGFNATEWNGGPGTLVVEGFRGIDEGGMDAFQYFLVDGEPIGRAPVGQLEFHATHQHWHFEEFTRYTLLDETKTQVQVSGKQSWCLANTDAIDLSVQNANWGALAGDLFTMCGGSGALWIREILDVGWGDTYAQFSLDQAFDVTNLPNGRYYIRTTVNPTGMLLEGTTSNNVEDRLIKLRGKPGARQVIVPPWHGIDTESFCYYCDTYLN